MRFLRYFFNVFISLVLLSLVIGTMFITCSRTLISKENISDFIIDASILNVDVNTLFNQEESGITLKEKIVSLAVENNIPDEVIEDILQSEEINDLLGDFFNQTIKYIINGGNKPEILDETIADMKLIASSSLDSHINLMLDEETLDLYIENYCNDITNIVPERDEVIGNINVNILEKILNFNVHYLYLSIVLVLVLTMILNKCWYYFIKSLGISMLISGVLFVLIGASEYIITNFLIHQINVMQPLILPLITNVLTIWFKSGVLVSFSSIFLILLYLTIHRITKNH